MSSDSCKNSFVKARDPSILAYNRPAANQFKENLFNLNNELSTLAHSSESENSSGSECEYLNVYLRIKPSTSFNNEVYGVTDDEKTLECKHPNQLGKKCTEITKYTFSKIYGPETEQKELFDHCVKEKLLNFMNGQNSTFFAYGTSGAGKTFTILGTEDNPGIIPRSLEYVFRSLPNIEEISKIKPANASDISILTDEEAQKEIQFKMKIINSSLDSESSAAIKTYRKMQQRLSTDLVADVSDDSTTNKISVWISFYEIYNEHVFDLLCFAPKNIKTINKEKLSRPKLTVHADKLGYTFVRNLTSVCVTNGLEAYKVLQFGRSNLQYASTQINIHSSRSHSIFTIKLVQYNKQLKKGQISHFNFCDLAGSERAMKSNCAGDRLRESSNINHSLQVLGRCIKILRDKSTSHKNHDVVPYRESKLTRLFQPALSGKETTSMIVNLNPDPSMFDENLHVLNFSSIAKKCISNSSAQLKCISNLSASSRVPMPSEEIQRLFKQMWQDQFEQQAKEFAEREEELRKLHVRKLQNQLLESNAANKKKIEETKIRCEQRYMAKLQRLETQYKEQIEFLKASSNQMLDDTDTIDLTEEEEESEQLRCQITQLESEVEKLQKQILFYKEENQKIKVLESSLSEKSIKLINQDCAYRSLLIQNEQLELELKTLREEHAELQELYSALALTQQDQTDYVEELENSLILDSNLI